MQARYDARNPAALERILGSGVQLKPFAQDIMTKAFDASKQLLADQAAKDPEYAKLYQHWQKARTDAFRWFRSAETAYAQFAFQQL